MPIEMKKRLAKTSRNGMMSATICGLYSDSERMMPATNAPSAKREVEAPGSAAPSRGR